MAASVSERLKAGLQLSELLVRDRSLAGVAQLSDQNIEICHRAGKRVAVVGVVVTRKVSMMMAVMGACRTGLGRVSPDSTR